MIFQKKVKKEAYSKQDLLKNYLMCSFLTYFTRIFTLVLFVFFFRFPSSAQPYDTNDSNLNNTPFQKDAESSWFQQVAIEKNSEEKPLPNATLEKAISEPKTKKIWEREERESGNIDITSLFNLIKLYLLSSSFILLFIYGIMGYATFKIAKNFLFFPILAGVADILFIPLVPTFFIIVGYKGLLKSKEDELKQKAFEQQEAQKYQTHTQNGLKNHTTTFWIQS